MKMVTYLLIVPLAAIASSGKILGLRGQMSVFSNPLMAFLGVEDLRNASKHQTIAQLVLLLVFQDDFLTKAHIPMRKKC